MGKLIGVTVLIGLGIIFIVTSVCFAFKSKKIKRMEELGMVGEVDYEKVGESDLGEIMQVSHHSIPIVG